MSTNNSSSSSTKTIESKTGLKSTEVDANTKPTITKDSKPAEAKKRESKAAPKESEAANPVQASLEAIKDRLSDDALRNDFTDNVADLICSYSRRKLDEDERQSLKNLVNNELLEKVFKIKKLVA